MPPLTKTLNDALLKTQFASTLVITNVQHKESAISCLFTFALNMSCQTLPCETKDISRLSDCLKKSTAKIIQVAERAGFKISNEGGATALFLAGELQEKLKNAFEVKTTAPLNAKRKPAAGSPDSKRHKPTVNIDLSDTLTEKTDDGKAV